MHNFIFRHLAMLRRNYWFWPAVMTFVALLLGVALPVADSLLGTEWIVTIGFLRPAEVEGARALLTTLAGAVLGVAGVAFSITIVAVNFASANYGPRLIGNFMRDRTNQIVLGVFVSTFVYCITVLATIHTSRQLDGETIAAFVPQVSVLFAMVLTLASVGALIGYIHHIPESLNIMNIVATIGRSLRDGIERMADETAQREAARDPEGVRALRHAGGGDGAQVRTGAPGYLQQLDLVGLADLAREADAQIEIVRAPGDFLVAGEVVMRVRPAARDDVDLPRKLGRSFTLGSNRTDEQDLLFLSDQLVEVLARALSPGVNDPYTAILCLDWLRDGLTVFGQRAPAGRTDRSGPVLFRQVTFETMLTRSFGNMRQYVASDRTVTLHSLGVLAELGDAASRPAMLAALRTEVETLAQSADEVLTESAARREVAIAAAAARAALERCASVAAGTASAPPAA